MVEVTVELAVAVAVAEVASSVELFHTPVITCHNYHDMLLAEVRLAAFVLVGAAFS